MTPYDLARIPPPPQLMIQLLRLSKRVLGARSLSRKDPISLTLFHGIVKKSDLENPVVLRNVTLYVLSFAGFF